jgi:hypothetical protein
MFSVHSNTKYNLNPLQSFRDDTFEWTYKFPFKVIFYALCKKNT